MPSSEEMRKEFIRRMWDIRLDEKGRAYLHPKGFHQTIFDGVIEDFQFFEKAIKSHTEVGN